MSDNLSLIKLHQQSADERIGQTLVRLARLAASAHRYEVTKALRDEQPADPPRYRSEPIVHSPCIDTETVHTEVDR